MVEGGGSGQVTSLKTLLFLQFFFMAQTLHTLPLNDHFIIIVIQLVCNINQNYRPISLIIYLQMPKVSVDEADIYKCYASNEYGKAVCTVVLNIIEGKTHFLKNPTCSYSLLLLLLIVIFPSQPKN